ncbi:MAG TPA: hypothetical protein VGV57_07160 [Thermoleophilaceae bacterium]|nr:hypothetical protein [Thermoleophilaceae bacterium]
MTDTLSFDAIKPLNEIGSFETSLPTLSEQAALRRTLAQRLRDEAEALDKIVSGVLALTRRVDEKQPAFDQLAAQVGVAIRNDRGPHGDQEVDVEPRGVEAVRAIMLDGGTWTVEDLFREMKRREWIDRDVLHPRKAVETAMHRLYAKYGEIERVGRGTYRYKLAPSPTNGSAQS